MKRILLAIALILTAIPALAIKTGDYISIDPVTDRVKSATGRTLYVHSATDGLDLIVAGQIVADGSCSATTLDATGTAYANILSVTSTAVIAATATVDVLSVTDDATIGDDLTVTGDLSVTGSMGIVDGDIPAAITRDAEWDTESELEAALTDVYNLLSDNDTIAGASMAADSIDGAQLADTLTLDAHLQLNSYFLGIGVAPSYPIHAYRSTSNAAAFQSSGASVSALWINSGGQGAVGTTGNDLELYTGTSSLRLKLVHSTGDAKFAEDIYVGNDSASDDDYVYFDGTEYIAWDNDPGEFDISDDVNISGGVEVSGVADLNGEVYGAVMKEMFYCEASGPGADAGYGFLANGTSCASSRGVIADRPGSIIGYGYFATGVTVSNAVTLSVYKNGASVWDIGLSNGVTTGNGTQAKGTDTFSAGDVLNVYVTCTGGTDAVEGLHVWLTYTRD